MKKRIFVIMLVILAVSCFSSMSIAKDTNKEYVIEVTGIGKISLEPDSFTVVFLVKSEGVSLRKTTKDNAEKIDTIIQEIKKLNIPNIEFSTSMFDFVKGKVIFQVKKYNIENELTVKAEKVAYDELSDYAASVIDIALQNGVTNVRNLYFYLQNKNIAEKESLKKAVDNAKDKASFIAEELGIVLKKPYNVLESQFDAQDRSRAYEYEDSFKQTELAVGKETFISQVRVEFKFE